MIQKALNLPFKQLLEMKTTSLFYNIPLHLTVTFKKFEKTANQNTSKKWNNWEVKRQRPEHSSLSLKTEVVTLCSAGPIFDRSSRPATGAQKCALSTLGQVRILSKRFKAKTENLNAFCLSKWKLEIIFCFMVYQTYKRKFMVKNEHSWRDVIYLCLHFVWFEFRALQNWVLFFFACFVLISVLSPSSKIKICVFVQCWKKNFMKMLISKRPVCVNTGRQNVRRVNKTTRRHDEGLQNPISERTTSFGQHLCMARNWKFLLLTWKLTLLEYTPAVQSCRGRLRRVT